MPGSDSGECLLDFLMNSSCNVVVRDYAQNVKFGSLLTDVGRHPIPDHYHRRFQYLYSLTTALTRDARKRTHENPSFKLHPPLGLFRITSRSVVGTDGRPLLELKSTGLTVVPENRDNQLLFLGQHTFRRTFRRDLLSDISSRPQTGAPC